MPDGRQVLNKAITRKILEGLHASTHWGTQALHDHFTRTYVCIGIWEIAKVITRECMICQRINKQVMRKLPQRGWELAKRPFQSIQIDFTELPQAQRYKYLLVIIDHLTHWVEEDPTTKATAETVRKILLEHIIPRYGIIDTIDSDRGPHFTVKILHHLTSALNIVWKFHTPWRPQSSRRVERMNQTLKTTLTKLTEETKMNCLKCLLLALLRIRTKPRADFRISPYEMMSGLPFLTTLGNAGTHEEGELSLKRCIQIITSTLEDLRKKEYLPQTTPIDFKIHKFQPGNWVLIRSWREHPLTPKWEGPFQVLLTTETAIRTQEWGWIHVSRVKGPVSPPTETSPAPVEWTTTRVTDTKLILKRKPSETPSDKT